MIALISSNLKAHNATHFTDFCDFLQFNGRRTALTTCFELILSQIVSNKHSVTL